MKKIVCIIFAFCLINILCADRNTNRQLLREIRREEEILREYQDQIKKFHAVVERKREALSYNKQNDVVNLRRIFDEDFAEVYKLIKKEDFEEATKVVNKYNKVYKNIADVADDILYAKAMIAMGMERFEKAESYLYEIVEDYNGSTKFGAASVFLSTIMINDGQDIEVVMLYDRQIDENLPPKLIFNAANAYYNIEDLAKAKELCAIIESDPEYSLRVKILRILMTLDEKSNEELIIDLQTLEDNESKKNPYFYVIPLLVARLYAENNDAEHAMFYYDKIFRLKNSEISDEIRYEAAEIFKAVKNYDRSIALLDEIVNNPYSNKYYTSAKYLLSIIYNERGDIEKAMDNIDEASNQVQRFLELLSEKNALLVDRNDYRKRLEDAESESERDILKRKITDVETKTEKLSGVLDSLQVGLSKDQIETMHELEQDYMEVNNEIEELDISIQIALATENTEIPKKIQNEISKMDSTTIHLRAMQYLVNLGEYYTADDYVLAKYISQEIFYTQEYIKMWEKILAKSKNEQLTVKVGKTIELLNANLESINSIALATFGTIRDDTELQREIAAEMQDIKERQKDLRTLKENVRKNYNKKLAAKYDKKKEKLVNENSAIKEKYDDLIATMEVDAAEKDTKFELTFIEILTKQSKLNTEREEELRRKEKEQREKKNN
jgi:hypothetical protein